MVWQKGSALITALALVAIVSGVITLMMLRQQIVLVRTQQVLSAGQSYWHSLGAEMWASRLLQRYVDADISERNRVAWPIQVPDIPVAGG